ncbi:MAG: LptF/LptG family permease, partial [Desulfatitalea sp.]|nr:LptF/LptG family permease [Desulfatitalea sp.]NNK00897.1 LptF/LptG family permease [Desulfatitalea sp.]
FMAVYGLPEGRKATKLLIYETASSHVDIGLKPRQFIDSFEGVVLYIHEIDPGTRILKNVFIEDRRSPHLTITVVAPQGRLTFDREQLAVNLRLVNGTINQTNLFEKRTSDMQFGTYDIRLDVQKKTTVMGQGPQHVEEMSMARLRETIQTSNQKDKRYYKALLEWHKKFSLPAANLALALLAVPLGIRARSAKRAYGIGLGLLFFLLYYIMLSTGWVLGESGDYPPAIGMWVPNLVSIAIGVVLMVRTVKEKSLLLPAPPKWFRRLQLRRSYTKRLT